MTRQVAEGSPITITARGRVGGFIPDALLNVDGEIFSDPEMSEQFEETRANGAGDFTFYAKAGTVITLSVDDPSATDLEPIQVVGVTGRPGGLAAVHPDDTPEVHEQSAISEHVTDSSLVGAVGPGDALPAEEGGAAAMVGVSRAQNIPPTPPDGQYPQTPVELMNAQGVTDTPDGTAATDPDAVAPPAVQEEQVTPMYEVTSTPGATEVVPDSVSTADPLVGNADGGVSTAQDVHGEDSPAVDPLPGPNADGTQTVNTATGETTAGTSEPA